MTRTRRAGAFLVALGAVAVLALLANPAGAQTSGGAVAQNGSVASGSGNANQNSTASGNAVATNGSTASGCSNANNNSTASGGSTAANNSTASGAVCPSSGGTTPTTARPATPTSSSLALTGGFSADMAVMAGLLLALGSGIVVLTRRRAALTR